MKILLLGANGQLGQRFLSQGGLALRGNVLAASRTGELADGRTGAIADLADLASMEQLLDAESPDIVVNAAAYTAVDRAETDETMATRVNGDAVDMMGRWAAGRGALVVHYSTDYVFAGNATAPYKEADPVGPTGAYGRSKLAGEEALRASRAAHFIFRTAWVYSSVGHNFLRTMLRLGATRDELSVVSDQYGTPTDTSLIVEGSLAAIDRWVTGDAAERSALEGTYHLTASGSTSWHGFAQALLLRGADVGLIPRMPLVSAISTKDYPTPAKRPAYSVLDTDRFARTFGYDLPDWTLGVDRTLTALSALSE